MKVAIPVDENKKDVCVSFGRAPYFLFHIPETHATEIVRNTASNAQGGAGIKAAQLIVDQGADLLITVRCGKNAAEVLQAADIKIYKADGISAKESLAAAVEGKLALLEHFHAGFHGKS